MNEAVNHLLDLAGGIIGVAGEYRDRVVRGAEWSRDVLACGRVTLFRSRITDKTQWEVAGVERVPLPTP